MVREAIEKELYDAVSKGDATKFQQLVQQDPYLVESVSFACSRNLLHIATIHRKADIVDEVLKMNPELARDLDSKMSSSLHIAAAKGSLEIAKRLLSIAPEAYWWRDCHDMNPVHIAAMNGHVEIVQLLLQESPLPALERVGRGETVLHLCVKHSQLRALKVLVERLEELVDAVDENRETILHLAVRCDQLETIRYLVESKKTMKRTHNSMDKTPLDILNESPPDAATRYLETRGILLRMLPPEIYRKGLADTTMVVVVLIATMAFQNAVNPPGGVWQDDTSSHKAGEAVIAYTHPHIYKHLVRANTTAFVSSIVTIFLITTGLPASNICFLMIAGYAMWVSMIPIAVSYGVSTIVINPNMEPKSVVLTVWIVILVPIITYLLICLIDYLTLFHFYWKRRPRHQEDRITSIHQRILYWVLQRLETWGLRV